MKLLTAPPIMTLLIFKKSVKVNSSLHLLKMPLLLVKLFSLKSIIQIQFLEWVSLLKTVLFLTMKADHMISSQIIVQIELQHRLITLIKECVSYCVGSTRGQNFSPKKCSQMKFRLRVLHRIWAKFLSAKQIEH